MPVIKLLPKTMTTAAHAEPTIVVGPAVHAVEPTVMVGPPVYADPQPTAGASSSAGALGFVMDPAYGTPGPVYVQPALVILPPPPPMVPGYIGDKVFLDANGNGLQDAGEAGIAHQTVQLFRAGADRVFGTADDQLVATQLTDDAGNYRFTHMFGENNYFLGATDYQVVVTPTSGYGFTQKDAGDDSRDSDFGADGRSQALVLGWGQNITSVDAGLIQLVQHNPGPSVTPAPEIIVGPNTPTPMPHIQLAQPTFTLNPEVVVKAATFMAGLPLLHGSDDLLHHAFGAPTYSATAAAGETMGHASDIMRKLMATLDSHAASVAAAA